MNTSKKSGGRIFTTPFNISFVFLWFIILVLVMVGVYSPPQAVIPQSLEIGRNRDQISFVETNIAKVVSVKSLPGTPSGFTFPIIAEILLHDEENIEMTFPAYFGNGVKPEHIVVGNNVNLIRVSHASGTGLKYLWFIVGKVSESEKQ